VQITKFEFLSGVSTNELHTSMTKVAGSGSNWLGDLAAAFLPALEPPKDGDCMGLGAMGIAGLSCDSVSKFVCQAPDPPGATPPPSIRYHSSCIVFQANNSCSKTVTFLAHSYLQQQVIYLILKY
jgi:hypothetical protein